MKLLKDVIQKIRSFFVSEQMLELDDCVFYISMGENLKSPLEGEEEMAMLKRLEEGDQQVKNILIEHNLRLVVFISKKFLTTGYSFDDLVSIGSIGLIKAVNSFKLDKNIKLATYASRCIENEILMFLRKSNKQRHEISLDESLKKDSDGSEFMLSDVITGKDSDTLLAKIEQSFTEEILYNCINNLGKREKEIMLMRFGLAGQEECTQKDVADRLEISQSYISRLEKKIMSKLKNQIEVATKDKS